jgi:hypothetical protein
MQMITTLQFTTHHPLVAGARSYFVRSEIVPLSFIPTLTRYATVQVALSIEARYSPTTASHSLTDIYFAFLYLLGSARWIVHV